MDEEPEATRVARGGRARLALGAIIYLAVLFYSSVALVQAPGGYTPLATETAWRMFREMPFVAIGVEGRADWMANVMALIPAGFMVTGVLWPRRLRLLRPFAMLAAFVVCFAYVLAVKFAQLYVPPRTVSLNYVLAQGIGVAIGVAVFAVAGPELGGLLRGALGGGRRWLIVLLSAWSAALLLFMLFPFDFMYSTAELGAHFAELRPKLLNLPGDGRPGAVRLLLIAANLVAAAPVGMLVALLAPRRPLVLLTALGFALACAVTAAKFLVLSSLPSLWAVLYLTAGYVLGAAIARYFPAQGVSRLLIWSRRLVPLLALPYLAALVVANGLVNRNWQTPRAALEGLHWRGLLPIYNYYTVSKAEALFSMVAHAAMYAPAGVMIGLLAGRRSREGTVVAGIAGFLLAVGMEAARALRPGLQPDINAIFVAGFAAAASARITALVWGEVARSPAAAAVPAAELAQAPGTLGPAGVLVAVLCAAAVAFAVWHYPLLPWALGAALGGYAVALWRFPAVWLAAVPACLPGFDFGIWSGWLFVGESDLVILVTVAVLALRTPPSRADLWPRGIAGAVLGLVTVAWVVGIARGLLSPLRIEGGTSLAYLMPENALRLGKGFGEALLLLPFLRLRQRCFGDAAERFGLGVVLGLLVVGLGVLAERASFDYLLDFSSGYRVVAMFTSMHVGGGHIGAYLAMSLPFLAVLLLRPGVGRVLLLTVTAVVATYGLLVTFARTAYASALLGLVVLGLGWAAGSRGSSRSLAAVLMLLVLGGGVLAAGAASPVMVERFSVLLPDLDERLDNWHDGLAVREPGLAGTLLGTGTGTYPRAVVLGRQDRFRAGNLRLVDEDGRRAVALTERAEMYFGEKVMLGESRGFRLSLTIRADRVGRALSAGLCEKLLLYSDACSLATFHVAQPGVWEKVSAVLDATGFAPAGLFGLLPRPIELTFLPPSDATIEITDIHLIGPDGVEHAVNGDFARGLDRWLVTDDYHWDWRIENQYLMSFFEGGLLGLAAWVGFAVCALVGAARAIGRGERVGAVVAASLVAFMFTGAFDSLFEAPRLATQFYLVGMLGMLPFNGRAG